MTLHARVDAGPPPHGGHDLTLPTTGLVLDPPPPPGSGGVLGLEQVVSRFGIVSRCDAIRRPEGVPEVHIWGASGPRQLRGWSADVSLPVEGTGVSADAGSARMAAIAEAVERYAAMAPAPARLLIRSSVADLAGDAVAPASLALLSPAQYRRFRQLDPLTETKTIDWCPGYSLTRHGRVWLPAALAYLSLARRPPNDFVAEVTTTGTACHHSLAAAILAALCEVLERDALTIAWQNRLPFTAIDPAGTEIARLLDERFTRTPGELLLFDVATDSPFPVVIAVARNPRAWPHAAVGAACRPHHATAAERALLEVSQVLARLHARGPRHPRRIRSFDDHADLYATPGAAALLQHLLDSPRRLPLVELDPPGDASDPRPLLHRAVDALEASGREVLVVELTTPDVAAAGLRVVRVVVPGSIDMTADARCPRQGGRRLYHLPVQLGLRQSPSDEAHLNRLPVPLA